MLHAEAAAACEVMSTAGAGSALASHVADVMRSREENMAIKGEEDMNLRPVCLETHQRRMIHVRRP